jgi:diaminopimelate epimerase
MEGAGNDYIYIDSLGKEPPPLTPEDIQRISERRFGIGADGVVIIASSNRALARMRMWNADGSPSAMCGNALRCVALYMHKKTGAREFELESGVGVHGVRVLDLLDENEALIEVGMGSPGFEASRIPVTPELLNGESDGRTLTLHIPTAGLMTPTTLPAEFIGTAVTMGNPHCVIFVDDVESFPVELVGAHLESHPAFPERTNVEFVSRDPASGEYWQRTFERGSGETLACGSGACAVLAASFVTGRGGRRERIHLRGGILDAFWDEATNTIYLTGSAREVFTGSIGIFRP